MTAIIRKVFLIDCDRCFWVAETGNEANALAWANDHDETHETEVS